MARETFLLIQLLDVIISELFEVLATNLIQEYPRWSGIANFRWCSLYEHNAMIIEWT